ncbi:hypothetical protein J45TS6_13210 [Paenibacillus sp. J45TS6]|nr:hypothetical protein J45TS6_13210 [Paenibacillus sp. J45TS6]
MAKTIYPCNGGIPANPTIFRQLFIDEFKVVTAAVFTPANGSLKEFLTSTISNQHI